MRGFWLNTIVLLKTIRRNLGSLGRDSGVDLVLVTLVWPSIPTVLPLRFARLSTIRLSFCRCDLWLDSGGATGDTQKSNHGQTRQTRQKDVS